MSLLWNYWSQYWVVVNARKIQRRRRYERSYKRRGERAWRARYNHWLKSKPRCVRRLLARFPPMTRVILDGTVHYVLGCNESGQLIVSHLNPARFYELAQQECKYVCAHHLERVS